MELVLLVLRRGSMGMQSPATIELYSSLSVVDWIVAEIWLIQRH